VEGVGTRRLLITGTDPWRVDEETHLLLDSTWNAAEVHLEGGEVEVAEASPTGFDRQGTGIKIRLATEERHGIWSAVVKEIIPVIHVTGAGRMRSHVRKTDVREESCLQAEGRGTGKTEEAGARGELVVHHATAGRMSRRRYRAS